MYKLYCEQLTDVNRAHNGYVGSGNGDLIGSATSKAEAIRRARALAKEYTFPGNDYGIIVYADDKPIYQIIAGWNYGYNCSKQMDYSIRSLRFR